MQDIVVGVSLLIEQGEHLSPLDLVRSEGEQLLRRCDAAGKQVVGIRRAALTGGEAGLEELLELAPPLPGEHAAEVVAGEAEEVAHAVVCGVVQVCRPGQRAGVVGQDGGETEHVLAIVADL